ncbi:MAG: pentapeptide repeat-containing protein [Candidatus Brocadiae bacterium]|nr:pentapeptide repeat-containing protein [Candidatus Brocadiia bacterium]
MAQINAQAKEIVLKLLYFGIEKAGKKTNLNWIYEQTPSSRKSPLQEEKLEMQQTFFFEYLAEPSFQIAGMKVKCNLFSISMDALSSDWAGKYLEGIDGIVFVVDSHEKSLSNNIEALFALENFLKEKTSSLADIPLIFQWNKQDIADAISPEDLNREINAYQCPAILACATSGEGIWKTLETILKKVKNKVQTQLEISDTKENLKVQESDFEIDRPSLKITTQLPKKWLKKTKSLEIPGSLQQKEEEQNSTAPSPLNTIRDESNEETIKYSLPPMEMPSEKIEEETEVVVNKEQILESSAHEDTEIDKRLQDILQSHTQERDIMIATEDKAFRMEESETKKIQEIPIEIKEKLKSQKNITKKLEPPKKSQEKDSGIMDLDIFEQKETLSFNIIENQEDKGHTLSEKTAVKRLIPPEKKFFSALPEKSSQEALNILKSGKPLENCRIQLLDLRNNTFEKSFTIQHCEIDQLLGDGSDFNAAVSLFSTTIFQTMTFGGENPSLFKNTLTLKDVEVKGESNFDKIIFSKKVSIMNSKFLGCLKMNEALLENGFSVMNSQVAELLCQRTHFRGPFTVTDTTFNSVLNLQHCKFQGVFLISSSQFQRAHFMNSLFQNKTEFLNCTFEKSGNFGKIQVEKDLTIIGCLCYGTFHIGEAYFKGDLYIRRTEFFYDASFSKLLACSIAIFEKNTFSSIADFSMAEFRHTKFLQTKFNGVTNFQESIFGDSVELLECEFNQRVHFNRTIFLQKVDFRETKFNGMVSFANLLGDYVLLNCNQIRGKLLAEKEKDYAIMEQEYLTLRKIFEKNAQDDDRNWAHWNAQRAARKKTSLFSWKPWMMVSKMADYVFLDLGCGYGTKPVNVLFLSFVMVFLFALAYTGLSFPNGFKPEQLIPNGINSLITSIIAFLPAGLTYWGGIAILDFTNIADCIYKVLLLAENTLGMFLFLLFTMTFFRKLLRY